MAYNEDKPQSSGAIYPNNYKESGTKQPDFTGSIEITKPLLKEIVDKMKNGEVEEEGGVKVRVALWDNLSRTQRLGVLNMVIFYAHLKNI